MKYITIVLLGVVMLIATSFFVHAQFGSSVNVTAATSTTDIDCDTFPLGWLFDCNGHVRFNIPLIMGAMIDMQGHIIKSADIENSTIYMVSPDHNCHILRVSNTGVIDTVAITCPL